MADNKQYDYSFTVLRDEVSDEDALADQTHKRCADALYRLITENDRPFTIGLAGPWGSGKSTVIRLLANRIRRAHEDSKTTTKEDRTLIYHFDAWAHEGDPLRMAFLLGLTDALRGQIEAKHQKMLDKIHDDITGIRKSITTRTTKRLSIFGKLLAAITAIAASAGTLIFLLNKNTQSNLLTILGKKFYFDDQITLDAFLILLGLLIAAIFSDSIPSIFKEEKFGFSSDVISSSSLEFGQKSTIEFGRIFEELLTIAKKFGFKKTIIVIDNIDRVAIDSARTSWSTLQTFFSHRSSAIVKYHANPQSKFHPSMSFWSALKARLLNPILSTPKTQIIAASDEAWFVVPFDRKRFSAVWGGEQETGSSHKSHTIQAFINKCFEVVIETPAPIHNSWIDYFEQQAKKALSGWPQQELQEVIETYKEMHGDKNHFPTPREMKAILNHIGTLGFIWKNQFRASSICTYAIIRQTKSFDELKELLISGRYSEHLTRVDDSILLYELSGLLFGVPPEVGRQIQLTNQLLPLILNSDRKINDIARSEGNVFWQALNACITENIIQPDNLEPMTTAAFAINEHLSNFKSEIQHPLINLGDAICKRLDKNSFSESESVFELVSIFLKTINPSSKANSMLSSLTNHAISYWIGQISESSSSSKNTVKLIENINLLILRHISVTGQIGKINIPQLDFEKWRIVYLANINSKNRIAFIKPSAEAIKKILDSTIMPEDNNENVKFLIPSNSNILIAALNYYNENDFFWKDAFGRCVIAINHSSQTQESIDAASESYPIWIEIISRHIKSLNGTAAVLAAKHVNSKIHWDKVRSTSGEISKKLSSLKDLTEEILKKD